MYTNELGASGACVRELGHMTNVDAHLYVVVSVCCENYDVHFESCMTESTNFMLVFDWLP